MGEVLKTSGIESVSKICIWVWTSEVLSVFVFGERYCGAAEI